MSRLTHVFVAGHIKPARPVVLPYTPKESAPLARKCAWHGGWFSEADQRRADQGAKVTHGMCERCARDFDRAS